MKVLSIGTDRKLFEKESPVLVRNIEYASKMDEMHIIVFSLKNLGLEPLSVGHLHVYPTNSVSRLTYVFGAVRICKRIIGRWSFSSGHLSGVVVSCQDPFETGLAGYLVAKKFSLPMQIQVHTDFFSPYFKNFILNTLRTIIARFLIPRTQGLRVVNEPIKNSIVSNFGDLKIVPEVLPVFVDVNKIINAQPTINIKSQFPQFKYIIFMASRLSKEKGIEVAINVFKEVSNQCPEAGLIIAGDGGEKKYLEEVVLGLGLAGKVIFIGWQKDLISYYKTADVFLLTSEYEGYGMTLIEAGASGCPIVTTQVGLANTDLFVTGKNSFVCPVGDVGCLSGSILELIKEDGKGDLFKKEMQDSIRKTATTKEEYTAKYVALLEKLLK